MRLIVITPENTLQNEPEIINWFFDNGLQRLHLRKPSFTSADYRNYIAAIEPQYRSRVVIHGSFELYDELKPGGIHLNSAMRNDNAVMSGISHLSPAVVSASFHSWNEIIDNSYPFGYVFISPVFDSISKPGYVGAIDLDGAKVTKHLLAQQNKYCPSIIGLGGVGEQQIKILHEHGFDGAAMLGAIWRASDPVMKFKEIIEATKLL